MQAESSLRPTARELFDVCIRMMAALAGMPRPVVAQVPRWPRWAAAKLGGGGSKPHLRDVLRCPRPAILGPV